MAVKTMVTLVIALVLLAPAVKPYTDNFTNAEMLKPIMDDAMYDTALYLRDASPPDAVLTVWWDKGNPYWGLAEREVNLRGAPTYPQLYWIALVLTAEDEEEALRALKLLDTGESHQSPDEGILDTINEGDSPLPPAYLVLADDSLPRYNIIEHAGQWNYTLGKIHEQTQDMTPFAATEWIKANYGVSKQEASQLYQLAATQDTIKRNGIIRYACDRKGSVVQCEDGFVLDLESMEGGYPQNNLPRRIVFYDGEGSIPQEKSREGRESYTIDATVLVYNRAGNYHSVILEPDRENTMFVRLLLLDGYGLPHFKLEKKVVRPETKQASVFRVVWQAESG